METSQADGGTRSGLLWEVERILDELAREREGNLPQILLMENVPEIIGKDNVQHFNKWLEKLESLGYSNFFEILNGKDYGVPQNRKRLFMVSILGDYSYDFPLKIDLKYYLKDYLEHNVNEKYYLNKKLTENIIAKPQMIEEDDDENCIQSFDLNYYNHDQSNRVYSDEGISPTIRTGHDEAKAIKVSVDEYGNKAVNETLEINEVEGGGCNR